MGHYDRFQSKTGILINVSHLTLVYEDWLCQKSVKGMGTTILTSYSFKCFNTPGNKNRQ